MPDGLSSTCAASLLPLRAWLNVECGTAPQWRDECKSSSNLPFPLASNPPSFASPKTRPQGLNEPSKVLYVVHEVNLFCLDL